MTQPVKYGVPTNQPVMLVAPDQVRIINLATSGKVWVGNNSGLRIGEGQPVNPGTSLLWTKAGAFYAIAEDAGSEVILTDNIEDYQPDPVATAIAILNSGVLVIDNPVDIFTGTLQTGSVAWIDVSRYQSLLINLVCTGLGVLAGDFALLEFSDDANSIDRFYAVEFVDATAANNADTWQASIPIVGKYFRAKMYGPGTTVNAAITASNRPAYAINQTIPTGTLTPAGPAAFYWDNGLTILAGVTLTIQCPPWFGEIEANVLFASGAAMGISNVAWLRKDINSVNFTGIDIFTPVLKNGATVFGYTTRIPAWGDSLRFQVANLTGGNFTNVAIRVGPVSGFGAIR